MDNEEAIKQSAEIVMGLELKTIKYETGGQKQFWCLSGNPVFGTLEGGAYDKGTVIFDPLDNANITKLLKDRAVGMGLLVQVHSYNNHCGLVIETGMGHILVKIECFKMKDELRTTTEAIVEAVKKLKEASDA